MVFQWLVRITAAFIVIAVLGVGLVYYLASRSLPDYDAVVRVPALSAPVEIVRDNANVPHIFGQSDRDVFQALGFAHTQDRLWQMMMLRRTAQGRLSELFGTSTVDIDSFLRRLDIYRLAVESVAAQDDRTVDCLGHRAKCNNSNTFSRGFRCGFCGYFGRWCHGTIRRLVRGQGRRLCEINQSVAFKHKKIKESRYQDCGDDGDNSHKSRPLDVITGL